MNLDADEWFTHSYPLRATAAVSTLTHPERFDFDVYAAHWQPTTRFAPSAVNPLYLDPDYAHAMPEELKQFIAEKGPRKKAGTRRLEQVPGNAPPPH